MIRNNKVKIIVSSIVILIPMLVGGILWDSIPDEIAVHWGINGEPDGFASKALAVFGLPLIMLALHWVAILATASDKRNKEQSGKVIGMMLFIIPVLSLFSIGIVGAAAFGVQLDTIMLLPVFFGVLFMIVGNYLPKARQNGAIGMRVKWTLESEECWNATHRFGGKVFFICGVLCLFSVFLPTAVSFITIMGLLLVASVVTIIYSYVYYKKHSAK